MFELINRNNHSMNSYNPFREIEDLERSFFGAQDLAEFKTDITTKATITCWRPTCPALKRRTSSWMSAATP